MLVSGSPTALLDDSGVKRADALAEKAGIALDTLVANVGIRVADVAATGLHAGARIAVWAGPGMNGADARKAAELLRGRFAVTVFAYGRAIDGDDCLPLDAYDGTAFDLVVDGLFGTGLRRPLDAVCSEAVQRLARSGSPVVSIDIPSGIDARTGAILGAAVRAQRTVTFEWRRLGHLLMPGRLHAGELIVAEIGIPDEVWADVPAPADANEPGLWLDRLRHPSSAGHKYDRGHVGVFAGPLEHSGASRLAAAAALRGGAGLVTLVGQRGSLAGLSAQVTAIMLRGCDGESDLATLLADARFNAFVLGPGFGDVERARAFATMILHAGRHLVLDADGISAFAQEPDRLFTACHASEGGVVLTPHAGEFKRLFPDIAADPSLSKLDAARAASRTSGAVVVSKGADTVIAAPDGRAAINATGTPWLATAGTGDVLAGIVAAQLAQGTPTFEAACAGVWMHGRAAELFGPGLISEDLPQMLSRVHTELDALRRG
ncbi:yjeF C-terminal region, hydroxyethylthiazole kinase-related/yjeF N-terminal region [Aureimonas phyllosphaerae]|uniref:NAD(P)H-hydrate dehydratase n=1 Tax=Aureimonas phyllosphaerae TaxID=1166078 RepID=UPI0008E880A9|nr:yjeF C-terminal region, hydroxyethylthiazole kinase-related/yjeF N-terminal region [Aureimonas phyllosphaerae]